MDGSIAIIVSVLRRSKCRLFCCASGCEREMTHFGDDSKKYLIDDVICRIVHDIKIQSQGNVNTAVEHGFPQFMKIATDNVDADIWMNFPGEDAGHGAESSRNAGFQ